MASLWNTIVFCANKERGSGVSMWVGVIAVADRVQVVYKFIGSAIFDRPAGLPKVILNSIKNSTSAVRCREKPLNVLHDKHGRLLVGNDAKVFAI
jgi:hypothetical protein